MRTNRLCLSVTRCNRVATRPATIKPSPSPISVTGFSRSSWCVRPASVLSLTQCTSLPSTKIAVTPSCTARTSNTDMGEPQAPQHQRYPGAPGKQRRPRLSGFERHSQHSAGSHILQKCQDPSAGGHLPFLYHTSGVPERSGNRLSCWPVLPVRIQRSRHA